MFGNKAESRNDLIIAPVELPIGKLIMHFQDTHGFSEAKRKRSDYRLVLRLEEIPLDFETSEFYVKITLHEPKSMDIVHFETPWVGGEVFPRDKYRDWVVAKINRISLELKDYTVTLIFSNSADGSQPLFSKRQIEAKAKRLVRGDFLKGF